MIIKFDFLKKSTQLIRLQWKSKVLYKQEHVLFSVLNIERRSGRKVFTASRFFLSVIWYHFSVG